jgi:hypothetical protein
MNHFHVPRPEASTPRGTSSDFINEINARMVWLDHQKKPEEVIRILCSTPFGVHRAIRISPEGADFLGIVVRAEEGRGHTIVAPLSQCAVMLSLVVPTAGEPEEKVILGFAEPDKT